jgi:hypothetical protein
MSPEIKLEIELRTGIIWNWETFQKSYDKAQPAIDIVQLHLYLSVDLRNPGPRL